MARLAAVPIEGFARQPASCEDLKRRVFLFGLDLVGTVKSLRRLASFVKQERVLLTSVETKQTAIADDFVTKTLTITYVEPIKGKQPRAGVA